MPLLLLVYRRAAARVSAGGDASGMFVYLFDCSPPYATGVCCCVSVKLLAAAHFFQFTSNLLIGTFALNL